MYLQTPEKATCSDQVVDPYLPCNAFWGPLCPRPRSTALVRFLEVLVWVQRRRTGGTRLDGKGILMDEEEYEELKRFVVEI